MIWNADHHVDVMTIDRSIHRRAHYSVEDDEGGLGEGDVGSVDSNSDIYYNLYIPW